MDAIRNLLRTEPAVIVGVIVAALALAGVTLTEDRVDALTQVLAFALPLVGSVVIRQNVSPWRADRDHEQ